MDILGFLTSVDKWILLPVIGLIAGWLAALILRERRIGIIGMLIAGVAGSFLGGFLFRLVGFLPHDIIGHMIAALVGAILLILLLRQVRRRRR